MNPASSQPRPEPRVASEYLLYRWLSTILVLQLLPTLRSRINRHLGITRAFSIFMGLPDPSISFSNNEQIFFARISAAADVCEAKGRFDFAVGYNS